MANAGGWAVWYSFKDHRSWKQPPKDGTPILAAKNNGVFWEYEVIWWDSNKTNTHWVCNEYGKEISSNSFDFWTLIQNPGISNVDFAPLEDRRNKN